ncbi:recombination regulator RecX [Vibrio sp. V27_P1S3P104]|uniref:recombination regulator RecX n=1 Tax=Vibrio TaxID=662 RepID=UPI000C169D87|nr:MULTISPECIES: recombination regulator RecX [Vibrio]NAW69537.1 recombination regulator RecX [Vibrio sp. V28_P6S34P95]NAX05352.1 recombination regulator RecX [Vibrio sp. V30_P3S12P165]NAX33840.1 recombination regulator RecX [Vibrio sp. V29_P1S30P107]NAX37047.1 recombination regulator RecX [Vibrio sp. V27_P1S3P104]NAX39756.1 recombination regulator RecX [Vibrio sp. V26_P1S5P106]
MSFLPHSKGELKPQRRCQESALGLLSRRDHSQYELMQKLLMKGFSHSDVEQAILYCQHYGYIDDLRYALSVIRQHISKGHGERRIRQSLQQNRVSDDLIVIAFSQVEIDWFELAKQAADKKFNSCASIDRKTQAKRIRFLQYRGFSFEQIQYALSDLSEIENESA